MPVNMFAKVYYLGITLMMIVFNLQLLWVMNTYDMFTDQWYGAQSLLSNLDQIDCRLFAFGILENRFIIYCRHLRQIYEVCIETREHWRYQGKVLLDVRTINAFLIHVYVLVKNNLLFPRDLGFGNFRTNLGSSQQSVVSHD